MASLSAKTKHCLFIIMSIVRNMAVGIVKKAIIDEITEMPFNQSIDKLDGSGPSP